MMIRTMMMRVIPMMK